MIIDFKEYREIHEQKKAVIWDFVLNYCDNDYLKAVTIYKDITDSVKSVNKRYEMIIDKMRKY